MGVASQTPSRYQCPRPTLCARPDRIPTATKSQCQWSHLELRHITDRTQSTAYTMRLSVKICLVMLLMVGVQVEALDFGSSGVWDSPLATDYWVKRFGFMWAGGRSGMHSLKALQKTADLTYSNEIPTSVYNPSGMYGLKAMGYMPDYPSAAPAAALTRGRLAYSASPEKKMVKLAPLKMAASNSFERFMAVP